MNSQSDLARWIVAQQLLPMNTVQEAWSSAVQSQIPLLTELVNSQRISLDQAHSIHQQFAHASASHLRALQESNYSRVPSSEGVPILASLQDSTLAGSGMDLMAKTTMGPISLENYEVIEELSRGGMGVVLRTKSLADGREVAVKLILGENPNAEEVERFRLEAKALRYLDHPNVIAVRDSGVDSGRPFLAMELVSGGSLKDVVDAHLRKHGCVPPFEWTVKVFAALSEALIYCHGEGIIHRDLKPANILIEKDSERPVIVDFGLVKRGGKAKRENFESIQSQLTATGQTLGTPAYMSPEQLDDSGAFGTVDEAADVWGLGATLFYCLTGEAPYTGATVMNIYKAIMTRDPDSPLSINSDVPQWLSELCMSCLMRQSKQRASLLQFRVALERFEKSGSGGKILQLAVLLFLGVFCLVATAWWFSRDVTVPTMTLNVSTELTKDAKVLLTGAAKDENDCILTVYSVKATGEELLGKQPVLLNFRLFLPLPTDGVHKFKIVCQDASGNSADPQFVTVKRDSVRPKLLELHSDPFVFDRTIRVTGALSEDGRVDIGGRTVETTKGRFSTIVTLDKPGTPNKLVLAIVDKAGNRTDFQKTVNPTLSLLVDAQYKGAEGEGSRFRSIQSALSKSSRSHIIVKPGRYKEKLDIDGELTLTGEGPREDIVLDVDEFVVRGKSFKMTGLTVTSTALHPDSGGVTANLRMILGLYANRCVIDSCLFTSKLAGGIGVEGTKDERVSLELRNCIFENLGNTALRIQGHSETEIEGCKIRDSKGVGIFLLLGGQLTLTKTEIDRCESGFKIHDSQGPIRIVDCKVRDNNRAGLDIHRSQGVTIMKCTFKGNGKTVPDLRVRPDGSYRTDQYGGLFVKDDSLNIRIKDCQMIGNKPHGLSVYKGAKDVEVVGSAMTGNSSFGVFVSKNSTLTMRLCKVLNNGVSEDSERGDIYVGKASQLTNVAGELGRDSGQKVLLKDGGIYKNP
ncbi:MAG: protein kinase [Planctomycetota bacterium]|nr:protein kinase [Planctomycetota bacterium]